MSIFRHCELKAKQSSKVKHSGLLRSFYSLAMTVMVLSLLTVSLTACGNKGSLKSPSEIEEAEAKKAKKEAKREKRRAKEEARAKEKAAQEAAEREAAEGIKQEANE